MTQHNTNYIQTWADNEIHSGADYLLIDIIEQAENTIREEYGNSVAQMNSLINYLQIAVADTNRTLSERVVAEAMLIATQPLLQEIV